jgi:hypothetical protein
MNGVTDPKFIHLPTAGHFFSPKPPGSAVPFFWTPNTRGTDMAFTPGRLREYRRSNLTAGTIVESGEDGYTVVCPGCRREVMIRDDNGQRFPTHNREPGKRCERSGTVDTDNLD